MNAPTQLALITSKIESITHGNPASDRANTTAISSALARHPHGPQIAQQLHTILKNAHHTINRYERRSRPQQPMQPPFTKQ